MRVSIVACVSHYQPKNKLAIGRNGDLLYRLKRDLAFFKELTANSIVVMGRKTWESIPEKHRPLKGRINVVLSRVSGRACPGASFVMTLEQFKEHFKNTTLPVYIIGGEFVYKQFMGEAEYVYLTEICEPYNGPAPDVFLEPMDSRYRLVSRSEKHYDFDARVNFRFLMYKKVDERSEEYKYVGLVKRVLSSGTARSDRTGVGTLSIFGAQMHFDISHSVPLLTCKSVPWKHVIRELLWMVSGNTDAKVLQRQGVRIWDGNTSREFLDGQGLGAYREGVLGKGYGWQWRFFGADYSQDYADTSALTPQQLADIGGFDQLEYVVNELRNNPFSRRIVMSFWNPPDFAETALLPCHYSVQFQAEERVDGMYLSCHFTMRSNDLFLGNPFNIFSYTVLTYILAKKCGMKPGMLVYTGGDVHLYRNHIQQVKKMLSNPLRPQPHLVLSDAIQSKAWEDITVDDFEVVGYFPNPPIKAPMAV